MKLFRRETQFDFVGKMRFFGIFSALLVLGSIVAVAVMGLNFGIDFAGGYEIQVKFPHAVEESQIRKLVEPLGLGDARVQRFGAAGDNEYLVLVREHGTISGEQKQKLREQFETLAGGPDELTNWAVAESGENVMLGFARPVTEAQVREVLSRFNLEVKSITGGQRADRPEYTVNLVSLADDIERALVSGLDLQEDEARNIVQRVEFVGPQVGAHLRNQGIMAVLYSLIFILLYIAVRFDLFFSPGAVVALIHDVSITVGVFALFQLEFNLPIVAAILALVGYSLNDTIVVYDRIRENTMRLKGRELRSMVNTSINQTLSRTLLTSGTTLLVVTALLVFGGGIIQDFAIALMIGVIVGTYSSVYIASPVYILLREAMEKRAARAGHKVATV